jgi:hypothetical protein
MHSNHRLVINIPHNHPAEQSVTVYVAPDDTIKELKENIRFQTGMNEFKLEINGMSPLDDKQSLVEQHIIDREGKQASSVTLSYPSFYQKLDRLEQESIHSLTILPQLMENVLQQFQPIPILLIIEYVTQTSEHFLGMMARLQRCKTVNNKSFATSDLDKICHMGRSKALNIFDAKFHALYYQNPESLESKDVVDFENEFSVFMQLDVTVAHLFDLLGTTEHTPKTNEYIKICIILNTVAEEIVYSFVNHLGKSNGEKFSDLLASQKKLIAVKDEIDSCKAVITMSHQIVNDVLQKTPPGEKYNKLVEIKVDTEKRSQRIESVCNTFNLLYCTVRNQRISLFSRCVPLAQLEQESEPKRNASYKVQPEEFKQFIKQFCIFGEASWMATDSFMKGFYVDQFQKNKTTSIPRMAGS